MAVACKSNAKEQNLAPNLIETSYWLDDLALGPILPEQPLTSADVVIVGAGYTGLNAALETIRGGRSTLVLDAECPGWGCSTRNGGQISTSVKPTIEKLTKKFGPKHAREIRQEGENALNWIEDFITKEKIDCDFKRSGRIHLAHTPKHYEALTRQADILSKSEGIENFIVPKSEQRQELGSDSYFGGIVYPRHASLHPAKYHRGLLNAAHNAGAHITGNCAVQSIVRENGGFTLATTRGRVRAKDVIIATNGYTKGFSAWHQRRIIPIGSYLIATQPLPLEIIDRLFPTDRIASDTRKVIFYYRASPDRQRVLFGGRVSAQETNHETSGKKLYSAMCTIFPELQDYQITHSWSGQVGYSFDELAHTGIHDGVYYALGYCGSGVSMASYLGMRTGQKLIGKKDGRTAFDDLPFPTKPFYKGNPWFLPAMVAWHQWRDRIGFNA